MKRVDQAAPLVKLQHMLASRLRIRGHSHQIVNLHRSHGQQQTDAIAAGAPIRGLDIGCGANYIYPLLGAALYRCARGVLLDHAACLASLRSVFF